jgi:Ca-activated chloride channel family protein
MPLSLLSTALSTVVPRVTTPYRTPAPRGAELTTDDGRSLPLVGAELRAVAKGGLARLVLEQHFVNRHEDALRVTYRMPLPVDGAVSAYAFEIEGRTIRGRVERRAAARAEFEQALLDGKTAALLEQNTGDIFTQELGNLPPRAAVTARITVDLRLAWLPEGEWELRFPTVIGPRYIGIEDAAVAADTRVETAVEGVEARVVIKVDIGDALVGPVASPTHALTQSGAGAYELRAPAALDRDIVVRWPVATRAMGLSLAAARRPGGDAYGLLTLVPPARAARGARTPRDLIVLLDTSGSMSGVPLDKAKQVVSLLIDSLDEADRLELIEFSTRPSRYCPEPVVATPEAKRLAIAWVRARTADGGTEMASAVEEALAALRPGAQRQVVLVSDGYVGGEERIVRRLHEALPKSCRLHFLGTGSSVNRSLAAAMARAGRGVEVLVGLDEDIEKGAKRLVDRMRAPVLTNIEILGSALERHAPEHLPDVFEGAPLVAAVALRPEGGELVIRGDLADDVWVERIRVPAPDTSGHEGIAALYAREHVADLETRWTIGDRAAVDREIEATGLDFQIATRLTSWLAIDERRRVDGPSRHEVMPQALPHGTTAASFGLRSPSALYPVAAQAVAAAPAMPHAPYEGAALGGKLRVTPTTVMAAHSRRRAWPTALVVFILLVAIALLFWLLR